MTDFLTVYMKYDKDDLPCYPLCSLRPFRRCILNYRSQAGDSKALGEMFMSLGIYAAIIAGGA
jgi:hypothetical protein